MRVNREIRAPKVRVIDKDGNQLGVMSPMQALAEAEKAALIWLKLHRMLNPLYVRSLITESSAIN